MKKVTKNSIVYPTLKSDSDEDGESGAASRMMHLVDLTGACNFAVIVSRNESLIRLIVFLRC